MSILDSIDAWPWWSDLVVLLALTLVAFVIIDRVVRRLSP